MNSFKILIVEDEILIADNINRFLSKKGHQVVGVAISYDEAIQLYQEHQPDMTLLDIRLNGDKTGIDVGEFIQAHETPKPFIYLTSQIDSDSLNKAKETFPGGYLSKPVQKDSLLASIEIIMFKFNSGKEELKNIPLYDGDKNHLVPIDSILFIEAEHIYVKVHLNEGEIILQRNTLKDFIDQLPEGQFLQTHRSFAINLKQISHWDSEKIYFGEVGVPVSRSKRKEVYSILKLN